MTDINMYTVIFEKNGNEGYAISCGDERITNVYAYVENGSLADTSYIYGLKQAMEDIKYACEDDLQCYYKNGRNIRADNNVTLITREDFKKKEEDINTQTSSFNSYLNTGRISNLDWAQWAPFNLNVTVSCPGIEPRNSGRAHAGCVAIAYAQLLAYLNPINLRAAYQLEKLSTMQTFTAGDDTQYMANVVGSFVSYIGGKCLTNYSCSVSNAFIITILSSFRNWGIVYTAEQGEPDFNRMAYNLWAGHPHVTSGSDSMTGGHAWLWDGIRCYMTGYSHANKTVSVVSGSVSLYCNWGWGGISNGWFSTYNTAIMPNGEIRNYTRYKEHVYITGTTYDI